jgi:hypothetical protein
MIFLGNQKAYRDVHVLEGRGMRTLRLNEMTTVPITEFEVQALIDSQLNWEEEKRVRKELETNVHLREYYEMLLEQKKLLVLWWEAEQKKKERELLLHS